MMPPHNGSGRWGRLRPVQQDPLDVYGLPSKGETRLLDAKTQERYYTRIIERYLAFCTEADGRDGLLERFASLELAGQEPRAFKPGPAAEKSSADEKLSASAAAAAAAAASSVAPAAPPAARRGKAGAMSGPAAVALKASPAKDLSDVLMALRKLREAIVATKRADDFSVQVYLFCIRLGILVKQPEAYHPAILYLLRAMSRVHPLTSVEAQEVTIYLVLDAACRRGDLAEAYRLRRLHQLHSPAVDAVLAALVRDDWVAFHRLLEHVDGHQAKLLEFAEHDLRVHTLKCFGRTYLRLEDVAFLEAATAMSWPDLCEKYSVGWELEGKAVVIRKIKQKPATA